MSASEPPSKNKSAAATTVPCVAVIKTLPNYDISLPPDVLAIMDANKTSHKEPFTLPPILKLDTPMLPSPNNNGHINMPETPVENEIVYDDFSKPLQPTPRRTGSY